MTWAGLLGRWVEFAQSAVALGDDEQSGRWKRAVADLIGLSALSMALDEADQLPSAERSLAVDRAGVLLKRHKRNLSEIFDLEPMHPQIIQWIQQAERSLDRLVAEQGDGYDAGS